MYACMYVCMYSYIHACIHTGHIGIQRPSTSGLGFGVSTIACTQEGIRVAITVSNSLRAEGFRALQWLVNEVPEWYAFAPS